MTGSPRPGVSVASELRVAIVDGVAWAPASFGHDYWERFLGMPTRTTLLCRCEATGRVPDGYVRVDGPSVSILRLPALRPGPGLILQLGSAMDTLLGLDRELPLILRMPGIVPSLGLAAALARRQSFAVQLVGDPIDVALVAGVGGSLRHPIAAVLGATTAIACRKASVVAYVTAHYLQRRYPPGRTTKATSVSNVMLPRSLPTRHSRAPGAPFRIITVAAMDQPYKRVDLVIEACSSLKDRGWQLELHVVGGGRLVEEYRALAVAKGSGVQTVFHGPLPHDHVLDLMSQSQLFVLGSDTEGMPRALIEAMAIGVPCVASAVGGMAELLPPYATFRRGSLASLIGAIRRHLVSSGLCARASDELVRRAAQFDPVELGPIRRQFAEDVLALAGGADQSAHR